MEESTEAIHELGLWKFIRSVSPNMFKDGMANEFQTLQRVSMEERQRKIEEHCISFDDKLLESVVLIFSATTRHNSYRPWQYFEEEESSGSGMYFTIF